MNHIYYHRSHTGTWTLRLPSGAYVSDQVQGSFWSMDINKVIKFDTQAQAQACADYLSGAIMQGITCHNLCTVELVYHD